MEETATDSIFMTAESDTISIFHAETKPEQTIRHVIPGEPRALLPGYDTGIMMLVLGVLVFCVLNVKYYSPLIKRFGQDLWSVRERENAFDSHTLNETRIIGSLILSMCICKGIILLCLWNRDYAVPGSSPLTALICTSFIAMMLYLAELTAYRTVGYAFTTPNRAEQWVRCFNATQSVLGALMIIPALILLFNPDLLIPMGAMFIFFYVSTRIIFIIKGFRIFYNNLFSLIYFILYLCTLEIVPVVMAYRCRNLLSLI